MDIELLSRMIGKLIVDHDQVGLPGVGTFVAEVLPATFSDRGFAINPPYRRLSFHPSRTEDSLLIDLYAEANEVSRDTAKAIVVQFLTELKAVLKDRKTIVLPGLGRLRATRENNFFFVPDEDLEIYPEGFSLKTVSLKIHQSSSVTRTSAPVFAPISVPAAAPVPVQEASVEPVSELEPMPVIELLDEVESEVVAEAIALEAAAVVEEIAEPAAEELSGELETDAPAVETVAEEETEIAAPAAEIETTAADEPEADAPAEEAETAVPAEETLEEAEAITGEESASEEPAESVTDGATEESAPSGPVEDAASSEVVEPASEPAPDPDPDPKPTPAPRVLSEEARTVLYPEESETEKSSSRWPWWGILLLVVVSLAVIALAVFIILANVNPDFIDSILYTPEELRILNY